MKHLFFDLVRYGVIDYSRLSWHVSRYPVLRHLQLFLPWSPLDRDELRAGFSLLANNAQTLQLDVQGNSSHMVMILGEYRKPKHAATIRTLVLHVPPDMPWDNDRKSCFSYLPHFINMTSLYISPSLINRHMDTSGEDLFSCPDLDVDDFLAKPQPWSLDLTCALTSLPYG